jgi:hypothetical protein
MHYLKVKNVNEACAVDEIMHYLKEKNANEACAVAVMLPQLNVKLRVKNKEDRLASMQAVLTIKCYILYSIEKLIELVNDKS